MAPNHPVRKSFRFSRRSAMLAKAGPAGAEGGTSISWRTKLASPVPLFATSSVTLWDAPGLTVAERGRGLASSRPAASAKSSRCTASGVIVALFVRGA